MTDNDHPTTVYAKKVVNNNNATGGAIYGLGIFGAFFYYLAQVHGLWDLLVAIFKSLFWPAYMLYEVMKIMHIRL
ncbi:MAG TPA: hypothetical protein VLE47_02155 [Candidatus Saccharimonadales bacterium]|nr:hypothetical protein [Candidatus Saccharimonadales bacterium]